MALSAVYMPADVYNTCVMHALSVEQEEVMGLLIGQFDDDNTAHIISTIILQRSDKRKDRVEISTEQLHSAMLKTQELSDLLLKPINVLGWYHSHPHITVQPSHVDLRTQASYQLMDQRFVGIIFSVFNEDKTKGQRMQVTCFQTEVNTAYKPHEKIDVPLFIEAVNEISQFCVESINKLPSTLTEEDLVTYLSVTKKPDTDNLTKMQNDAAFVQTQCHISKTTYHPIVLNAENRLASLLHVNRLMEKELAALHDYYRTRKICRT